MTDIVSLCSTFSNGLFIKVDQSGAAVSIHMRPFLSPEEFAGRQARSSNEFSNPDQLESRLQVLYSVQRMYHLSQRYKNP